MQRNSAAWKYFYLNSFLYFLHLILDNQIILNDFYKLYISSSNYNDNLYEPNDHSYNGNILYENQFYLSILDKNVLNLFDNLKKYPADIFFKLIVIHCFFNQIYYVFVHIITTQIQTATVFDIFMTFYIKQYIY